LEENSKNRKEDLAEKLKNLDKENKNLDEKRTGSEKRVKRKVMQ